MGGSSREDLTRSYLSWMALLAHSPSLLGAQAFLCVRPLPDLYALFCPLYTAHSFREETV
jgi:hypothetical protein